MNARNIVVALLLIALLAGGFFMAGGGAILAPKPTPTPEADVGELVNLVTASGTLLPQKNAALSFKLAGQVSEIAAKAGQIVKQGDVLIRLDAAELQAAVSQAEAACRLAQANLEQLRAGASKEDMAVAQANVEAAQAQLASVRAGASKEEVAIVRASLDRAAAALTDAQSAYDKVRHDPAVGMFPQSAALQLATQEYQIAQARYNQVLKGASPEDIRIAEAAVNTAQASLDRVSAGARPQEIAAAEAREAQAQAALDQAQGALRSAVLVAPFDGLVAEVAVNEGETVAPAVPVLVLGDVSRLHLETNDLSETDIARVHARQISEVSFEALPGKRFKGTVTEIAPMSSAKQGGTNYTVTVEFTQLDESLRWGMTGHVEIDAR